MKYVNETVRRQDRLLDEASACQLLREGEYGVLSLIDEAGGAYGVPLNYVWDGGKYLYVHCAPAGRKLRCMAYCPDVSFCVVGRTRVASSRFTTAYESIVLHCLAEIGLTPEEKKQALDLLLDKYSPNDKEIGRKYAEKSFHRTEIIRLTVKEYSGKCKRIE